MRRPRQPIFLARRGYRMRRVRDAARALPFFGLVLFLLPLLWGRGTSTAAIGVYLFAVWFGLILAAGVMAARLGRLTTGDVSEDEDELQVTEAREP